MTKKSNDVANNSPRARRVPMKQSSPQALVPTVVPPEGVVLRDGDTMLVSGRPYLAHGATVPAVEIYYVDGAKRAGPGEWLHEADKVAWRDPATGYECIMLRNHRGGHLCGYVGVPPEHPMYGFEQDAIAPDLGIEVHGGITYARHCEESPASDRPLGLEARRICHVPRMVERAAETSYATDYRTQDRHAWWFGFECDHLADVVPKDPAHRKSGLEAGIGQIYRNDAYVFTEVTNLAAQLYAVAEGLPMPPRLGPPLPPLSLDPRRGH